MRNIIADTSMGLMKAFNFLLQEQRRPAAPKFTYASAGSAVHARFKLSKATREKMESIVAELRALNPKAPDDSDRIKQLIAELTKLPVKFIPVKRQTRVDNSKVYPYHDSHYSQQAVR